MGNRAGRIALAGNADSGELGPLVRLAGAAVASVLRTRGILVTNVDTHVREAETSRRVALRVTEAAKMLGLSRSAMYEIIGKRQIGVVRLGSRSIRIPTTEVERLLTESLVPRL
jgi:excisionase family DNA binding protein